MRTPRNDSDHRATSSVRTLRRSRRMRLRCSRWSMCAAATMMSFIPSMSCGLTRSAPDESSSAAPVNSESTSTPRSSERAATYSFATRFMPSRSAVTSMTSAARYSAAISSGG
ncbi:Uncharacterised protein [Mycobacteroides abscessus]|nr:Uncharacterised protein [Mycobacteroides abscessus]